MLPHVFLQGPSGMGKSTILREVFAPHVLYITGFVIQRLTENGLTVAFRTACLDGAFPPLEAQYDSSLKDVFLLRRRWMGYDALERALMHVLEQADRSLIVLDEIGGIELGSPVFMGVLERILSGPRPCFGVFKARENLDRALSNLNLSTHRAELQEKHKQLEMLIRANGDILTVTGQNRNEVRIHIEQDLQILLSKLS